MKENLLDADIAELEKLVFSSKDTPPLEEPITEGSNVEPVVTQQKPSEPSGPTLDEVIKRSNNYKASTDLTIRDLRADLAQSKTRQATLQKELIALQSRCRELESKGKQQSIFSEEDVDILGEPAVNALNKGVNEILEAKMKPLQDLVDKNRQESADREAIAARELVKENYNRFLVRLEKLVPDYITVNEEPGFLNYMSNVDEASGFLRKDVFAKAEQSLDVGRIASFFQEYKRTLPPKGEDILQSAITPSSNKAPVAPRGEGNSKDPVITTKFIDKYYDDFARGKYKTKKGREEAAKIEAMIDRAVFSNQVY